MTMKEAKSKAKKRAWRNTTIAAVAAIGPVYLSAKGYGSLKRISKFINGG